MSSILFYYFICFICITGLTNAAYLRIYNDSIINFKEFDLEAPLDLLKSPGYDPSSATVIYAFGFGGQAEGITVRSILGTYLQMGGYNTVLLNWEKEASKTLGPIYYPVTTLAEVAEVGKKFGVALYKLVSAGLDLERTHLIGFSLGAHIMGYAGRKLQKYNLLVPRITGLDPASPLFDEGVVKSLTSDSAGYVDILHTNPGQLGSDKSLGTVDFWFNCQRSVQPGCEALSPIESAICSHDRSWLYFTEALERKTAFKAISASSCSNWCLLNETGSTTYVGETEKVGNMSNFYLSTNNIAPYGKGADGIYSTKKKWSLLTDIIL